MTSKQKKECHGVIHTASMAAAGVGAGLAQIPGSDSVPLTAIQLTMTISLGKVFGKSLSESSAKAAMGSVAATTIGRTVSQAFVGWWPGIGNVVNGATAAAVTEALGWALAEDFDKGLI
jgi:uncharacterized protein (DUF697 family)